MSRATDAEICRKAARQIERKREDRSCYALARAEGGTCFEHTPVRVRYTEFMLDGEEHSDVLFPDTEFGDLGYESQEATDVRVLALCFMACAIETGDA